MTIQLIHASILRMKLVLRRLEIERVGEREGEKERESARARERERERARIRDRTVNQQQKSRQHVEDKKIHRLCI
jgi:hypothetical protein